MIYSLQSAISGQLKLFVNVGLALLIVYTIMKNG